MLCTCQFLPAAAQPTYEMSFRNLALADGLSQNTVMDVLQDSEGETIRDWPPELGEEEARPVLLAVRFELADMGEIVRLLEVPDGAL